MNKYSPIKLIFAASVLFGLAACDRAQGPHGRSCADMVTLFRTLSPSGEAKSKMRNGDMRFLAVHSYSISVPGVDTKLVSVHGYRQMKQAADFVDGESCEGYYEEARRFAEAYNREILYLSQTKSR